MQLNFRLYQNENIVLSHQNISYKIENNYLVFNIEDTKYQVLLTPENFIFHKKNNESKFSIDYARNEYLLELNNPKYSFAINCLYHQYEYLENRIEFTYRIESNPEINKIILEIERGKIND